MLTVRVGRGSTPTTVLQGIDRPSTSATVTRLSTRTSSCRSTHRRTLTRASGPQVQPKLSFGGGRLMLTFYESRGRIANYGIALETLQSDPLIADQTPYISGYDRVMDFRTALLDPVDGRRISSAQISRYPLRIGADFSDGQDLSDVAAVNFPLSRLRRHRRPICVRQVNRVNAPTSAEGSSPFIGDYPDTVPYIQFVPDGSGGWRWAIEPDRRPDPRLPRHLDRQPPPHPASRSFGVVGLSELRPASYRRRLLRTPARGTRTCLTSRVATEVLVSAPTTYKQLDRRRSFPFSISNTTGEFRRFRLQITDGAENATFSPKRTIPAFSTAPLKTRTPTTSSSSRTPTRH